MILYN